MNLKQVFHYFKTGEKFQLQGLGGTGNAVYHITPRGDIMVQYIQPDGSLNEAIVSNIQLPTPCYNVYPYTPKGGK